MNRWPRGLAVGLLAVLAGSMPAPASAPAAEAVGVDWRIDDQPYARLGTGPLPVTGLSVEIRRTALPHGARYDVRLRNRAPVDHRHGDLRIRLPRDGRDGAARIEGLLLPVPAEVRQSWTPSELAGAQYGFVYAVESQGVVRRREGPSRTAGRWGGRATGIVRVDGHAYVVPEFWERQPRRIAVTEGEVVLTMADAGHPLRAGEEVWDRFGVVSAELSDAAAMAEVEGLPALTDAERRSLLERFGLAPEGLRGSDAESEAWLRRYDRWQGTAWEKRYADDNPARRWDGDADASRTTLFSLFQRGRYYPIRAPGAYTWRDYGDIPWGGGMSSLHYDWLRAAFKHYLRSGNAAALRWGMAAARHAVTVDFVWDGPESRDVGLARYEKGDHGGADFPPKPSHTWGEGLFLAAAVAGDPWLAEAARARADGLWRLSGAGATFTWDGAYGELRTVTWPLLLLVRAFRETGDLRYWTKAQQLVGEVLRAERASGGHGYVRNYAYDGNGGLGHPDAVWVGMAGYSVPGLLLFADVARSRAEPVEALEQLLGRMARWVSAAMPKGPYVAPSATVPYGRFVAEGWCPPGNVRCAGLVHGAEASFNWLFVDLLAWMAGREPEEWTGGARRVFRDAVTVGAHPGGIVGYLTDQYPESETKILGRAQLFGDRAALWLAGRSPGAR